MKKSYWTIEEDLTAKHQVLWEALSAFGFRTDGEDFVWKTSILDGAFEVFLRIDQNGHLTGRVLDLDLLEDYTAFRANGAVGPFVGQVREAYRQLLLEVVAACYEESPFVSPQANRLYRQIQLSFGDRLEPFGKFPSVSCLRIPETGKWYALMVYLNRQKLDETAKEAFVDLINVKVNKSDLPALLEQEGVYPSYHMSKTNWVSLVLDDSLSDEFVLDLVTQSRQLVAPKAEGSRLWVIPANPKYYDIDAEFATDKRILWTQKAGIKAGDWVVIYMTAPHRRLRYLCLVEESDLPNQGYRDRADIEKLMRLCLVKTYPDQAYGADKLKELGLKSVRGPRRVPEALYQALAQDLKATED